MKISRLKNLRGIPYKMSKLSTIHEAVADLKKGRLIIVLDSRDRENEGDLVCAAEKITPEKVNFMIRYGRGLVCTPITKETADRLKLALMNCISSDSIKCKFTVSLDLSTGITTGISAYDRAKTIKAMTNDLLSENDFCKPGHVFPILVNRNGILARPGHSEASIELCKLAHLKPVAVICEIIKDNGKMARLNDLLEFSMKHKIKVISIKDLINHLK